LLQFLRVSPPTVVMKIVIKSMAEPEPEGDYRGSHKERRTVYDGRRRDVQGRRWSIGIGVTVGVPIAIHRLRARIICRGIITGERDRNADGSADDDACGGPLHGGTG
jgi:hypothetical protein